MLESIAIIVLSSLILGSVFKKLRLPPLLAMLTIGIVFGPFVLDIIDQKLLDISYELRQLALVIILTRAGLSLNLTQLRNIGRPALLMSFVPALCEIMAYVLFATLLMGVSVTDALLIGSVMAAISPAVVVPKMLKLKELGYDSVSKVPSIITASSSVDDVFVIVLFTAFVAMAGGDGFNLNVLWHIPVSILLGIVVGVLIGKILSTVMKKCNLSNSIKVVVLLCISVGLLWLENLVEVVPYSALLSIISLAVIINTDNPSTAKPLSDKYAKLWIVAEIMLFALIGAEVDISYALDSGAIIVVVILLSLLIRMLGVFLALLGSGIAKKERLFCAIAYTPKATVQAAIGGVALAMALPIGQTVLSFAVIGIIITAPLGAFLIEISYKKLLPPLLSEK
ncbi:MAG: cation:proton antiporter [Bacillota bacterium]